MSGHSYEAFGGERPLPPPTESKGTVEEARCWECPFAKNGQPNRPVVGEGPSKPLWITVGEGPGRNEAIIGRPFVGASGAVIDKVLATIKRPRADVWITNSHCCLPFDGATEDHKNKASEACAPRLRLELAQLPGVPILSVGAPATRVLLAEAFRKPIKPPKEAPAPEPDPALVAQLVLPVASEAPEPKPKPKRVRAKAEPKLKVAPGSVSPTSPLFSPALRKMLDKALSTVEEFGNVTAKQLNTERQAAAKEKKKTRIKKDKKPKARRARGVTKGKGLTFSDLVSTLHISTFVSADDPRQCIPTIHPAAILRSAGKPIKGTHSADLAYWNLLYDAGKVDALARGVTDVLFSEDVDTEVDSPARATRLVLDIIEDAYACGEVAIDLETTVTDDQRHHALMMYMAEIKAIGIATPARGISVMWDLLGIVGQMAIRKLLLSKQVTKGFHNGLYDRTVLRARGFMISGNWYDTMLAHHATFPGMAHKLQLVAGQFFAIRNWKSEFRDGDETPHELTKYCVAAGTPVMLADGTTVSIEHLVRRKADVEVLSYNTATATIEPRRVVGWHKARVAKQKWVRIKTTLNHAGDRGLVATPDHTVYTARGELRADQVRVGDQLRIGEPALTAAQRQALIGTLLGDSILTTSPSHRGDPHRAPGLALSGGHANRELADYKLSYLRPFLEPGRVRPAHSMTASGRPGQAAPFYVIASGMLRQFADLARVTYDRDWRRTISVEALEAAGDVGLAWWFADDGCRQNHAVQDKVCLSACRYSRSDLEAVQTWFCAQFGPTYLGQDRVLRLGRVATAAFCARIAPHLPPCVRYKLPQQNRWPAFVPYTPPHQRDAAWAEVTFAAAFKPPARDPSQRLKAETRFCLTVEGNHNFFTSFGLVANCGLDTLTTARLRAPLEILVRKNRVEKVYEMDRGMAEIAGHMHLWGVPMDRDTNEELLQGFRVNVKAARAAIEDVANDPATLLRIKNYIAIEEAYTKRKTDPEDYHERRQKRLDRISDLESKSKWSWGVDKSTHVVGLLRALGVNLYKKTDSGRTSTSKEILEALVDVPIVRRIVQYRENAKLLSTFVWSIFDRLKPDGTMVYGFADQYDRVHPSWSVTKISGRWASTEPGLSNVPKADAKKGRPNLRKQVIAPKGRIFVGFDFAQLEARIIGLISGDPWLCKIFSDGRDVHTEAMKLVWGPNIVALKDVDKKRYKVLRDAVKRFEYGAFYGGSVETLWKTLLKDDANAKLVDVQKAVGLLMSAMPNVVRWQDNCVQVASRPPNQITSFLLGRRRVFPLQADRNEAINIGAQSAGADIMDTGMWRMWQRLPKYKWTCFPILQIHDAAVFECNEDDADKVKDDVIETFTQEYESNGITVPFPIEVDIARSWAEC